MEALNEAGTLYLARGDLDRAAAFHRQALELARRIGSSWDEAHALAGLGRCDLATGQTGDAKARLARHRRSSSGSARPRPATFPANWAP